MNCLSTQHVLLLYTACIVSLITTCIVSLHYMHVLSLYTACTASLHCLSHCVYCFFKLVHVLLFYTCIFLFLLNVLYLDLNCMHCPSTLLVLSLYMVCIVSLNFMYCLSTLHICLFTLHVLLPYTIHI